MCPTDDVPVVAGAPNGVLFTTTARHQQRFGSVISEFESAHQDTKVRVHVWDLIVRCCAFLGHPVTQTPDELPGFDRGKHTASVKQRKAAQKAHEAAAKAAKAAAAAGAAELDETAEDGVGDDADGVGEADDDETAAAIAAAWED